MRIVFMGTPDFAKQSLMRLYRDGHDIACAFTQPDKPRNRGMKVSPSPVKDFAIDNGIPVFQPPSLRDGVALDILRGTDCDLIAVVAYGKLLPREILEFPPLGCINIHGSLLPKYRGAAPIQWAIINGEKETGVTSIYMAEEMDAGDMILRKKTAIGDDETAEELYGRLGVLGAELLSDTVGAISRGIAARERQNHDEATFAPPLNKEMSRISWMETGDSIKCKVRGLNPWPSATAEFGGTVYKVFMVDIGRAVTGKPPGTIVSTGKQGIEVSCIDGTVIIKELQAPGSRRMAAADFLRGCPDMSLWETR